MSDLCQSCHRDITDCRCHWWVQWSDYKDRNGNLMLRLGSAHTPQALARDIAKWINVLLDEGPPTSRTSTPTSTAPRPHCTSTQPPSHGTQPESPASPAEPRTSRTPPAIPPSTTPPQSE